jgi:hypothetical protein
VDQEPWFADDPVARNGAAGRPLVSPVPTGDVLWDELARDDAELAAWCADRWLGAWKQLGPAPAALVETRLALHRVAEHVIAPTRQRANGKIGLRYTHRGFGTPFFGRDAQIRVVGDELCVQVGERADSAPITTLKNAAEFVGFELTRTDEEMDRSPLAVDREAALYLGDWFGFAFSVLEELRATVPESAEPSRVQIWPEHFDAALELGSEEGGTRAAYGCSPGDETHPEPYLYVAPWTARPTGELWRATGFAGAECSLAQIRSAGDQRAEALEFFRSRLDALSAG